LVKIVANQLSAAGVHPDPSNRLLWELGVGGWELI
jgi:hypothetical protein